MTVTGMVSPADFGAELRLCRQAAGLSLRGLAELVEFDFSYLSQVERGQRYGSIRLIRRCDAALNAGGFLVGLFTAREIRQHRYRKYRHYQALLQTRREQPIHRRLTASTGTSETSVGTVTTECTGDVAVPPP